MIQQQRQLPVAPIGSCEQLLLPNNSNSNNNKNQTNTKLNNLLLGLQLQWESWCTSHIINFCAHYLAGYKKLIWHNHTHITAVFHTSQQCSAQHTLWCGCELTYMVVCCHKPVTNLFLEYMTRGTNYICSIVNTCWVVVEVVSINSVPCVSFEISSYVSFSCLQGNSNLTTGHLCLATWVYPSLILGALWPFHSAASVFPVLLLPFVQSSLPHVKLLSQWTWDRNKREEVIIWKVSI